MKSIPKTANECAQAIAEISLEAKGICASLTVNQLNFKPNPKSWSIAQVLDHLVVSNCLYYDMFDALSAGTYKPGFGVYLPFLPKIFGSYLIKGLAPGKVGNMPAPKVFQPSQSLLSENVFADFEQAQETLIKKLQCLEKIDPEKVTVTSPAGAFIGYSLADLFSILAVHEARHLLQIKRVIQTSGFPKL